MMKRMFGTSVSLMVACGPATPRATTPEQNVEFSSDGPATAPVVAQAEASIEALDFEAARAALEPWLAAHPRDARASYDLGLALEGLGDTSAAKVAYRTALDVAPRFAPAATNLGLLLRDEGDFEGAVALLRDAARLADNRGAWENLALALEDAGSLAESVSVYESHSLVSGAPTLETSSLSVNYAGLLLKLERVDDAARVLDGVDPFRAQLEPGVLLGLANGQRRAHRFAEAVASMETLLARTAPTARLLAEYALALNAAERTDDALAALQRGKALSASEPILFFLEGVFEQARGHKPQARAAFERYLQLAPTGEQSAAANRLLQQLQ